MNPADLNPFVAIVLLLCLYGLVVFFILAVFAWLAEGNERFDQTIADHGTTRPTEACPATAPETTTTGTLPPENQP